jgi:broad specificity phosphatase PhoE
MTEIYLVRHGETEWNREEMFRGRKDIPLNNTGEEQANKVSSYFKEKHVDLIVSSPMKRAMQTAEPLSRSKGIEIKAMAEFTDMNFGAWEGSTLKRVKEDYPLEFSLWEKHPDRLQTAEGESLETVRARVSGGLADIDPLPEQRVVIVTHRVICKIIVLYALGIENSHFWDMRFDPCSITLLEYSSAVYSLIFSNDTCHLEGRGCLDF